MKIETLKHLIRVESERTFSKDEFMEQVFRLLDVFEKYHEPIQITFPTESEIDKLTKKFKQDAWASK
jgi:hypothetical protein